MWAHYAHNYRGYVVEFDSSHPFFKRKGLMGLRPITYGTRTVNNWLELENTDFLATKSDEWKYEQEWRAMRPLTEVDIVNNGYHLFEVPRDAILAIITCEQTDPTVVTIADSACAANGWSVKRLIVDKLQKKLLVDV
nr:DUF2971 domain-containing protein [Devosia sp. MC1541]